MKKFTFLFLLTILMHQNCLMAADSADEQLMRPALTRNLLKHINWTEEQLNGLGSEKFNLCVFKHYPTYRNFTKHLVIPIVDSRAFEIKLLAADDDMAQCHAVFARSSNESEVMALVEAATNLKVILIGEGKEAADLGMHFGMFVGENKLYEFEINLDAFAKTEHAPSSLLYELGSLIQGSIVKKANLMRSLIGYTNWPVDQPLKSELVFCVEENNFFTQYTQYLLQRKPLKERDTQFRYLNGIDSSEELNACQVVLLSGRNEAQLKSVLFSRASQKILLIGDAAGLGEKGVHYNLILPEGDGTHRFEINLSALAQTGHEPHYQLLNSALIVRRDLPSFSQMLLKTVQFTDWPETAAVSEQTNLCLWRPGDDNHSLAFFDGELKQSLQSLNILEITELEGLAQCKAVFIDKSQIADIKAIQSVQQKHHFLIIASSGNAENSGAHYNLKVAPKAITLELFEDNLKKSGFTPQKILRELGTIVGGKIQ